MSIIGVMLGLVALAAFANSQLGLIGGF